MNEFNNLPTPIKIGAGSLGVITIGGVTFMIGDLKKVVFFLCILAVLLLLFLGGWLLWRSIMRRKRNASISGGLVDDGRATPKGISDPAKRAKLDDLRKKFLTGVNEYRSRGKDLYKLPWYVICGPPGAGKTEAIRRCNVGFPPGMQDGLQGVGGTINMNWWFTNHAVILDTAGKLMFEEVSPGETSEWKEFLTLLKKSRPNCPINGLFLAISVEDLIKDSAEKILQKAGKIAQQLDVIQRVLDVRFPVYVIVTKCDLLTGFREFFDDITDPQLQHQMVGWSNPEPLDTSFRAELVDQHLKSVSQRLRQRRLGLLRDPVPESSDRRRTDEVDAMFALPNSLTAIGPRLRRYLETIFVAGEWSAKPLFLRGIYFTSSMREGSALDEELASAIGVPVGELPAGRGWERERSYFLRDLFMEKVFKERGLVTRATNTGQMLRRRRAVLYGTGFLFLALFGLFAYLGQRSFRNSIGNQSGYWIAAGQPRLIVQGTNDFSRSNAGVKVDGKDITQARFHEELRKLASTKINYRVFRLVPHLISGGDTIGTNAMQQAQAVVFERNVIKPLMDETWKKLESSGANLTKEESDRESAALKRLLEIQTQLETGRVGPIATNSVSGFLTPLMTYVTDRDWVLETNLFNVMHWVYAEGARKDGWPPVMLTNTQSSYVLTQAFGRLLARIKTKANIVQEGDKAFEALLKSFDDLQKEEKKLPSIISNTAAGTDPDAAFKTYRDKLNGWKSLLAMMRTNLMREGAGASGAYALVVQKGIADGSNFLTQAESILPTQDGPTSRSLRATLNAAKEDLQKQVAQKSDQIKPLLAELDRRALAPVSGSTGLLYQARADVCLAISGLTEQAKAGGKFASFSEWQKTAAERHQRLTRAHVEPDLFQAASNYLERTTRQVAQEALTDYTRDMRSRVLEDLRFPMLRSTGPVAEVMSISQISSKRVTLQEIEKELSTPAFTNLLARQEGVSLSSLTSTLQELGSLAAALVGVEGIRPSCQITLVRGPGNEGPDRWQLTAHYLQFRVGDSETNLWIQGAQWSSSEINLDKPLGFNFYKRPEQREPLPDLTVQHGAWGPLRMLHEGLSDRTSSDLTRRVTHALTADDKGERSMVFDLNFTNARLPSLDRWPTMESVTSGLSLGKKP